MWNALREPSKFKEKFQRYKKMDHIFESPEDLQPLFDTLIISIGIKVEFFSQLTCLLEHIVLTIIPNRSSTMYTVQCTL